MFFRILIFTCHIHKNLYYSKNKEQFYDIWYIKSEQTFLLWSSESCYCVTTQKSLHTRVCFSCHIMMCQWISSSDCFEGSWSLTLEGDSTMNPWNIRNQSSNNAMLHPIRHESSVTSLQQPDISSSSLAHEQVHIPWRDEVLFMHPPTDRVGWYQNIQPNVGDCML